MDDAKAMQKNRGKRSEIIKEFIRYLFVGGSAFLIDFSVLYFTKTFIFGHMGEIGILISTAIGFIAGLIYNYILSIIFVFKQAAEKVKGKQAMAFTVFAVIGIVGLLLTEGGMYVGIMLLGFEYYLVVKVFVAAVVLMWNYIARKVFIFK